MQVGDDLTQAMVQDARNEPGALPLTESALSELWNYARDRGEQQLSKAYYEQHHGVVGMLAKQADSLINRQGDKGRKAALNLLLALTQINEGGRHTRRRLDRDDAVHEAGGGQQGEAIVMALAGKHDDSRQQTGSGQTLPLIVTGQEGKKGYVELVHELLVRGSGRKDEAGNSIGYWPTLYRYIYKHRDRDSQRQQLKVNADRWNRKKGIHRFQNLATSKELKIFSNLRPRQDSPEDQYLRRSRKVNRIFRGVFVFMLVLAGLWGWWMLSFEWASRHDLPQEYALKKMLWTVGLSKPPLPEMVPIEGGTFKMGCLPERDLIDGMTECPQDELPVREVTLNNFSMSRYEITFEEYDYYFWAAGQLKQSGSAPDDEGWGRGNRPVINVSWKDANGYVQWLGQQTGQACRLPSEAEWEYAARAGTDTTYYSWSNEIGENKANCRDCGSQWDDKQTAPVGQFRANDFGLHDMHGNVQEWVQDCYAQDFSDTANYEGAPMDGSAREVAYCGLRVLRGGSWYFTAGNLRSASRDNSPIGFRLYYLGFRVLCSAPSEY